MSIRFVCAAEYNTEVDAAIAAGMLESNGIPAHIEGSLMATIYAAGATWAPVRLLVPSDRLADAIALLRNHHD